MKTPLDIRELAFIALGSNLGDSVGIVRRAMDELECHSLDGLLRSSVWETTPVDCPPGSPAFVNAVVGLRPPTDTQPEDLLAKLQAMEVKFGRTPRRILNEPRALDLDLIAFGLQTRHSERLTLPHPRAHTRRFVLEPLNEIAPDLVLPGQTLPIRALLAALKSTERVRRIGA